MAYKHSYIIDSNGYKTDLVLVIDGDIQHYTLKDGETLVDIPMQTDYVRPRWDGTEWVEGATKAEIAVILPSLEDLADAKATEIRAISEAKVAKIQEGYTLGEINTFEQQYTGAVEILTNGVADDISTMSKDAQFVISLARGRSAVGGVEVTPEYLAEKIIANYTAAKEYTVAVLSVQQGLETKVQLATSREELQTIQWPETV